MSTATITNEDLLNTMHELMHVTSEGFASVNLRIDKLEEGVGRLEERVTRIEERLDSLEARMDGLEKRMDRLEIHVAEIEHRLSEHDLQFAQIKIVLQSMEDKHAAYINDIEDILDRIQILENRMPDLTIKEVVRFKRDLHQLSNWARKVAKMTNVPL